MKKGEKVQLTVKPQCKRRLLISDFCSRFPIRGISLTCLISFATDGFGEKGKPASSDGGAVPSNATLQINLELVSWKIVSSVTDDKKVVKKILKEGEGYEKPNEGAVVKCKSRENLNSLCL